LEKISATRVVRPMDATTAQSVSSRALFRLTGSTILES
jgi:hypothetical protein